MAGLMLILISLAPISEGASNTLLGVGLTTLLGGVTDLAVIVVVYFCNICTCCSCKKSKDSEGTVVLADK